MEQRQARLASVRRRMEEAGLGQLLITDHLSIYRPPGRHVGPGERRGARLVAAGGGAARCAGVSGCGGMESGSAADIGTMRFTCLFGRLGTKERLPSFCASLVGGAFA